MPLSALPDSGAAAMADPPPAALLADRLAAEGLEILWVDCSPRGSR